MQIHASQIIAFNTCPRMYKYQYINCLRPKVESDKLFIGTGGHLALAAYYSGQDPLAVYDEWTNRELARIAAVADDEQYRKMSGAAALGRELVEHYAGWARENNTFTVLAVEQEFAVPVWFHNGKSWRRARAVTHAGRFDGVVRDVYGKVWLMEHKFYSYFPSESELRRDEQAGYYLLAASQLYDDVVGIVYNVVRKVHPKRAKESLVRRYMVMRNNSELRALAERLYRAVRRIRREKYFDPTPGQHCAWKCAYGQLCIAEDDGTDVQDFIDAFYTREEAGDKTYPEEGYNGTS